MHDIELGWSNRGCHVKKRKPNIGIVPMIVMLCKKTYYVLLHDIHYHMHDLNVGLFLQCTILVF